MFFLRSLLIVLLLSSCAFNVKHRPFIDSESKDVYCVFGTEYEVGFKNNDVFNLRLSPDSTYEFDITHEDGSPTLLFKGDYRLDHRGLVTLLGEHPLKKSTIQISESRTFVFRMNDNLKEKYPKKHYAYCESGGINDEECSKD